MPAEEEISKPFTGLILSPCGWRKDFLIERGDIKHAKCQG
jgi:hypothetical protein